MPELRQNLATKEWVIVATERAQRPDEFRSKRKGNKSGPDHDPKCPFCRGNEKMTPEPTHTVGNGSGWRVRVVPNKFPALVQGAPQPSAGNGLYRVLPGEGIHEVIVDSPSHSKHTALLDAAEMEELVKVYHDRYKTSVKNEKVAFTWNSAVDEVLGKDRVEGVKIRDLKTGAVKELKLDGLFIAIGHTPNTAIFEGQLDMDKAGYIITRDGSRTSVPGVFASGDCQDHVYRQAVTAAGTGCAAAIDAERFLAENES